MQTQAFLTLLAATLPKLPMPGQRFTRRTHTAQMTKYLHTVAREAGMSCVCHRSRHDPSIASQPAITREVLYDFSLYHGTGDYALPDVVIEHENSANPEAFLYGMWKLMVAAIPLRIMIGYIVNANDWEERREWVTSNADLSAWHYPDANANLVLLGRYGIAPSHQFVVLHREVGNKDFHHLGLLGEFRV